MNVYMELGENYQYTMRHINLYVMMIHEKIIMEYIQRNHNDQYPLLIIFNTDSARIM